MQIVRLFMQIFLLTRQEEGKAQIHLGVEPMKPTHGDSMAIELLTAIKQTLHHFQLIDKIHHQELVYAVNCLHTADLVQTILVCNDETCIPHHAGNCPRSDSQMQTNISYKLCLDISQFMLSEPLY
jgi:hypothetical protein